ncbi:hypothetical protein SEVIR_3G177600v4 [Setaria viridis]
MSWQTYVDEHLMCEIEGHHLTAAAIVGHDGAVWAQSAAFPQFKAEEMADIMKDFDKPGHLAPTGMFLGTTKYMVIQGEPGAVIRGKKTNPGLLRARPGGNGRSRRTRRAWPGSRFARAQPGSLRRRVHAVSLTHAGAGHQTGSI